MPGRRDSWLDIFRSLGQAFFEVVRAELAVVAEHGKLWGRNWAITAALLAMVVFMSFWLMGLLAVAGIHGLMDGFGLRLWQAALAAAAALFLTMAILGGVGYWLATRHGSPITVFRDRLEDHRGWFGQRILGEERAFAPSPGSRRAATSSSGEPTTNQTKGGSGGATQEPGSASGREPAGGSTEAG